MVGQAHQAGRVEPRDRHCTLGLLAVGQAPPALARRGQLEGLPPLRALPDQEVDDRADVLAALELDAAQFATEPAVEFAQRALALSVAVVRHPACYEAVHLFDHPFQRAIPAIATSDLTQAILGSSQTLAPDAKCSPLPQAVAEELAFPDRG